MDINPITESVRPFQPSDPQSSSPHRITKRSVTGWVLYDLANTIFSMGVISVNFSLWLRDEVGHEKVDSRYGVITAISMGIIFFASPLLGSLTDRAKRRMPFLVGTTLVCVFFTALLARFNFYWTVLFFIIANIAYQAGTQFYDALLPEVSTEENRGRIGGIGVGIGYLGSFIALGIGSLTVQHFFSLLGPPGKPLIFLLTALLFLAFSIPCFLFVKERGNPHPRPFQLAMLLDSTRQTMATLRASREYPGLLRFLVGRIFYTDPINTVISVMSLYTVNVAMRSGLDKSAGEVEAYRIMGSAIAFAIAGGFFWGWLTDKHGPKRTLNYVLRCWIVIFTGAAAVGIFALPMWTMYGVAVSAGFCLGGVWASDRPYMLRLTPPTRIGEFYGLYGMVGRFSAVTGPLIWATSISITNHLLHLKPLMSQGFAILVLLLLMILSYRILQGVSDERRQWA